MTLPDRYAEFQGWMREELVERITELECELRQKIVEAEQRMHADTGRLLHPHGREETVRRLDEMAGSHGPYRQYDFAAGLEQWMREHGFAATSGASFGDLLDELSAQVSDKPRN